jgi:hypothetical protein
MNRYLIKCTGWIGDMLFTSSVAERLKAQDPSCEVDLKLTLVQPKFLFENNPHIDGVIFGDFPHIESGYTHVFEMPELQQNIPATYQFQRACGVTDVTLPFDTYTLPVLDIIAAEKLQEVRDKYPSAKVVAYQANWDVKSREYTKEQYESGMEPYRNAPLRDIERILHRVSAHCVLVAIGFPETVRQTDALAHDPQTYAYAASVIKHCDMMIGGEGGLTNLAASVHTPVVMTTDFMWSLYGPYGAMKQFDTLAMGPATYYPNDGHVHLDPYLTDDEVIEAIIREVKK